MIPVPFGYTERFKNLNSFNDRMNKSVGLGSVNPLRMLDYPVENFKEVADYFPDESWMHATRRMFVKNEEKVKHSMDLMFPFFPQIKDFKYDLVEKFNSYKMFTSCESIFYFPSAKSYEGSACGTVNVCIDHDCNKEFGFVDGENCIMYEEGSLDSFNQKIEFYQNNPEKLSQISMNAEQHAFNHFRHEKVAEGIINSIAQIYSGS